MALSRLLTPPLSTSEQCFSHCDMQDAVKVMAKSLVRNRHAVTKMYSLKSQLQAVSLRMAVRKLSHWPQLDSSLTKERQGLLVQLHDMFPVVLLLQLVMVDDLLILMQNLICRH